MASILITVVLLLFPIFVSSFSISQDQYLQTVDPACTSDRKQMVTFHEFRDYTGRSEAFCSNQPELQSTPGFGKSAIYVCVNRGVWVLGLEINGVSSSGTLVSGNIGKLCIFWPESFSINYTSIRHLASADMDQPAISFFTGSETGLSWRGQELYLDGNEMRLSKPMWGIGSYGLTGSEPITIYAGTNYDGEFECLVPGKNDPFSTGVTFHDQIRLRTIGSVRKGCDLRESGQEPNHSSLDQSARGLADSIVTLNGEELPRFQMTRFAS